ncbi:cell division protein ZapA [Ottowia sp. GY511]|uniref:Cell division protein ZapA n=1 Tax=Ottowia flava TaxID=2675430 RepID=A0ABW4KUZ8_9BURK|nr:cell division protein ZapA [Ottowia sp. GY511]TXK26598.1 cell division protein ZapA [Ottowia sp. GY511]
MKQIEVKIMGQAYLLGAPEGGESRLQAAVQRVDAAMCKIRDGGKIKARDRIAVLAALNMAYELTDDRAAETEGAASAAPSGEPAAAQPPALSVAEQATLGALLTRLDKALGDDGRLL